MDSSFRDRQDRESDDGDHDYLDHHDGCHRSHPQHLEPSAMAGRPAADARHDLCWCGQDMDVVRGNHCPRCGTMRVARVGAVLSRLAA